ncbi:MAG: SGNH/GDSL hydrolase family protein [Elusimicrobiota bacterium]|jgi:lysophospholipase L1-like esterase|nr:SGNH/GDSL hydrolase family protein [Elusimicrobiota bacterium]
MKNVLCFGDSNTYGYNPHNFGRFEWHQRWTGILQKELGTDFKIIEEGYNGRTTLIEDSTNPYRNSRNYLFPILAAHAPLDLIIICLGTNDTKARFNLCAASIAKLMQEIVRMIKTFNYENDSYKKPEILLLSPIEIGQGVVDLFDNAFDEKSVIKSKALGKLYKEIAQKMSCHFFDLSTIAKASDADYLHLDEAGHLAIGRKLCEIVKNILGGK